MAENKFKIGDRVRLKEDTKRSFLGIPPVSKHLTAEVLDVEDDSIFVYYAGFMKTWAISKYFELADNIMDYEK